MAAAQPHCGSHRRSGLFFRDVFRGDAASMEPHMETVALPPPQQQRHPPLFSDFSHEDGDGGNGRKRPRETTAPPARLFSLQTQQASPGGPGHKVINLAQLQRRPPATCLRLDFDDGGPGHVSCCTSSASSFLTHQVASKLGDQCRSEMDRLIQEHADGLRRALADTRCRHSRSLLGAAEALALRRVREKEAEASRAARRGAELEEQLARLRAEAAAWQAKAMSDHSTAAVLHAQLQQAAAAAQASNGKGKAAEEADGDPADDAESGFVDPDRVVEVVAPPLDRPCRACRLRLASTVLLPCRHLCVCHVCEPAVSASAACPMCGCPVTGTVQVFFS